MIFKYQSNKLNAFSEKSSPLQAATKLVPVPESLMSPDFRPPSGLCRILPIKTPPSKLSSPIQVTTAAKVPCDTAEKPVPILNTTAPTKMNVSVLKSNDNVKRNSAPNCSSGKANIAKPIITNANGKCPQSVKINNYVQSKTLPIRRSVKNSPNLGRNKDSKAKATGDVTKPSALKKCGNEDISNATAISSDEESEVCQAKLNSIRHKAVQRRQEDTNKGNYLGNIIIFILLFIRALYFNFILYYLFQLIKLFDFYVFQGDPTEKAAVCIQRMWRGYHTRNLNKKATNVLKTIEMMRTNKYIQ